MRPAILGLSCLIVFVSFLRREFILFSNFDAYNSDTAAKVELTAEEAFASGKRISLRDAGLYELELIPGVNSKVISVLLEKKNEVLIEKIRWYAKDECKAYRIISGIGEKTARHICSYIAP